MARASLLLTRLKEGASQGVPAPAWPCAQAFTGTWWPRHCLVTRLWPGSPGQGAPVWTRHPREDGHHLATHPGAAWIQQGSSAVAGRDVQGLVPEQEP